MKTVLSVENVTVKVKKNELLQGEYIHFQLLSEKLKAIEEEKGYEYKKLRNRFYNSFACGKYETKEIAGLKCVFTTKPMKGVASLVLDFEVEE